MKKLLLMLSAAALSASANAQSRLTLYEEFSGENCAPCAATNPGLWTLINGTGNASKIMIIKYQVPIPTAGPIYNAYPTIAAARRTYYGVSSAPNGRIDGAVSSPSSASPGHPGYLTQAEINTSSAVATPFNMTTTHTWNAAGDSITVNVNMTAASAYAPAGANLKLRVALIEHLAYCTAPGTNGEKDFHNVVREMYPDANGTQLPNSWTASQSQNYTVKGKVPAFVNKSDDDAIVVVWVQNDGDKSIAQAAKSNKVGIPSDAAIVVCPTGLIACASGASTTVPSTISIKNTGTNTLTSAKVYYKLDAAGTYSTTPVSWTGSLAPGASATVTIPALTATAGSHVIYDSVATPNGSADVNSVNNMRGTSVNVVSTAGISFPVAQSFETSGGFPTGYSSYEPAGAGNVWVNGNGAGLAHNASSYMPWYKVGTYAAGSVGYMIMPTPKAGTNRSLEFYQAYAQNTASNNDKLEVVYSTNCGGSWTSLWSASGTTLATTSPTTTYWLPSPTASTTDWKLRTVSLTALPNNALLAFRATADGGNNLFIDDINLKGTPAGVENVIAGGQVSVYPNPAKEAATLEFYMNNGGKVVVTVLDAVGRTVANVTDATLPQGAQHFSIPTTALATGAYNIAIRTEEGVITQRLSVVK